MQKQEIDYVDTQALQTVLGRPLQWAVGGEVRPHLGCYKYPIARNARSFNAVPHCRLVIVALRCIDMTVA